jgi:small multidrug resistance pump
LPMNNWVYLGLAIFSEVIATASLKSTEGFTRLVPSIVVLAGYSAAFYFLPLTLDTIPIGVAYAVWSGVGVATITLVSFVLYDQKIDAAGLVGIGLIVAGVVVLRLFSEASVDA